MKKYIVITGASSGIGYSTAIEFAKKKKNLILIARRKDKLEELKKEILLMYPDLDVIVKQFDLTDTTKIPDFFSSLDNYDLETWINNAGFGMYSLLEKQDIDKSLDLLKVNVEALTIFSTLFVQKYHNKKESQLINVSSAGGYTLVPTATLYCASKFFVSSFTEGLALELIANKSKLQAKVLAPAATKTEFGSVANNTDEYDYDKSFNTYHTSADMAKFLIQLYESDSIVGHVSRDDFTFKLSNNIFNSAYNSTKNQNT